MKTKIGKFIFLAIMYLLASAINAEEIDLSIDPQNPVANEPFNLIFKIETSERGEPYISFDPGTAEVLGKSDRGVSINTTIINGKFSTKRVITVVYEMVSSRSGSVTLRNIKAEVGSKTITHKDARITILSKSVKPKDIFLVAIPSKTDIYIGEGINVEYYLYYRVPIVGQEIKQFPKLNKFLKRFHRVNEREETVEYNGIVYRRSLKYAARLYPEKTGTVIIDPLTLNVQFASNRNSSPFGNFGLHFRSYKTKTIGSETVKIDVKPLPAENVPPNFTGLVGEHDFKLIMNKNRFLVNEAIELRLEVNGVGALENMDAPKLYSHENLEEFDTKSEIVETSKKSARKNFDYTYLARGPISFDEKIVKLSYFDPEKSTYIEKEITLPSLNISGTQVSSKGETPVTSNEQKASSTTVPNNQAVDIKLLAPIFSEDVSLMNSHWIKYLNYLFSLGIIGLLLSFFMDLRPWSKSSPADKYIKELKRGKMEYAQLYKLLIMLDENGRDSLSTVINDSTLSKDAKLYFSGLVDKASKKQYGQASKRERFVYRDKHFKELSQLIRNANHNKNQPTPGPEL